MKVPVADIQHSSLHDGPGIRTTVFFKGCPLNCAWCHNPECIEKKPQLLYYPEKCIGCGKCEQGCFSGAKVLCGKEMTEQEIFSEILLERDYYGEDGGVTFSGGEPLLYPEMLKKLISLCHENGINTAIETSLFLFDSDVLSAVDHIMADFKIFDDEKHKHFTGVSNKPIIEHFKMLNQLNKPFTVRTPVIPEINGQKQEIINIKNFLKTLKNVTDYQLLPYHPLGSLKAKALCLEKEVFEIPSQQLMEELNGYAEFERQN